MQLTLVRQSPAITDFQRGLHTHDHRNHKEKKRTRMMKVMVQSIRGCSANHGTHVPRMDGELLHGVFAKTAMAYVL